ncbi:MAG TPA: lipid-binding SYLF domain-containing protein [Pyrinomonadaceae bacterium]|jgi:lipid-binding SYLF domain-containing protein
MKRLLASSRIQFSILLFTFLYILLLPVETHAQKIDKSKLDNAAKRSATAALVLTSVVNVPDTIPREIFDRARAVGVFPDLDRISFVLPNSRLAYGVICSRVPGGWSPPAYYGFGAPKIPDLKWKGRKRPDIIILFMSDKAMEEFQKGNFVFKEEMVGIAGPVGALTPEKENEVRTANVIIYALVDGRVEGLRIDANDLGGGAVNPDNNINNAIYGLKAREVLFGKAPLWPSVLPSVSEYQNALINLSKR